MVTASANLMFRVSVQNLEQLNRTKEAMLSLERIGVRASGRRKKKQIPLGSQRSTPPPPPDWGAKKVENDISNMGNVNAHEEARLRTLNQAGKIESDRLIRYGQELRAKKLLGEVDENSNRVAMEAARIRETSRKSNVNIVNEARANILAADEQAAADYRAAEEKRRLNMELKAQARNLIQTSISMFVLTITMTQALTSISQMVGTTTTLGKAIGGMTNFVKMALGPMQVYISLQQIIAIQNKELLISALPLLGVFGAIFLIYQAFNQESKAMRITLMALAGGLLFVTFALKLMRMETIKNMVANIANMEVASLGSVTPMIIGALALAGILAGAAVGLVASFQTEPGQFWKVRNTGPALVHKDEVIGTPGNGRGFGGSTVIFNVQGDMSTNLADRLHMRKQTGQYLPFIT